MTQFNDDDGATLVFMGEFIFDAEEQMARLSLPP